MRTEEFGGLGDIPYRDLHRLTARYRFLFSPMRYTSLPLAVIEAMTIGMPVVALATTALPDVIQDGVNGFVSQDPESSSYACRRCWTTPSWRVSSESAGNALLGSDFAWRVSEPTGLVPCTRLWQSTAGNRQAIGALA